VDIHECERKAQELGFDKCVFNADFPNGTRKCRWLDAHMGLIGIEGLEGFIMSNDIDGMFPGLECTDLRLLTDEEVEEEIKERA
jgi:hypothetical protein